MDEFFDHYLLGKPRPSWMDKGVPFLEKGTRDVSAAVQEGGEPAGGPAARAAGSEQSSASIVCDSSVPLPAYQTAGAAGFDLASSVGHDRPARRSHARADRARDRGARGHVLGVFARSSTPLKRGLMVANGVGVVDCGLLRAGGRDQNRSLELHGGARRRQARRSARAGRADSGRARGLGRTRARRAITWRIWGDRIKLEVRSQKLEVQRITRALRTSNFWLRTSNLIPTRYLTRVTYTANPPGVFVGMTCQSRSRWPRVTVSPTMMPSVAPARVSLTQCALSRTRLQETKAPTA